MSHLRENLSTEVTSSPTKILNVEIPESVYWHVRRSATESKMSMKEFMTHFCKKAEPIHIEVSETDDIHGSQL